ncbi:ATP-binding cassette domain-containing protein [Rhodococcus hoagii]|nr:ATP-binding cassette domain-containing protein [Prescottella equi]
MSPGRCVRGAGSNGAGKTTTIRMLATLLPIDGGSARVRATTSRKRPRRCAPSVPDGAVRVARRGSDRPPRISCCSAGCTGTRGLRPALALRPAPRRVRTPGGRRTSGQNLFGGMRRRIDIAASIIVTPELIFLDEPTTGPIHSSRNQVWEIVRALVAEAPPYCSPPSTWTSGPTGRSDRRDRPRQGHRRGHHRPAQGLGGLRALHVRVAEPSRGADAAVTLERTLGVPVNLESDPAALTARIDDPQRVARALAALDDENLAVTTFALGQPSLDEVFLA